MSTVYILPYPPTPYNNIYVQSSPQTSPLIPDVNLYPPSPYSNPNSLPASPLHNPSALPNPVPSPYQVNFPSNHPFGSPGWATSPTFPHYPHSYPHYPSTSAPGLHPYLNGEYPRGDLIFDLSLPTFSPIRYMGPGQSVMLSAKELNQPATDPPITSLEIICDLIPQWPIILEYEPPSLGYPPPITVYDIMMAVWQNLHVGITHEDWDALSEPQMIEVARAYTRRCRKAARQGMTAVRAQGVKKVDFLMKKVWFKGLLRTGESYEQMRLVVA